MDGEAFIRRVAEVGGIKAKVADAAAKSPGRVTRDMTKKKALEAATKEAEAKEAKADAAPLSIKDRITIDNKIVAVAKDAPELKPGCLGAWLLKIAKLYRALADLVGPLADGFPLKIPEDKLPVGEMRDFHTRAAKTNLGFLLYIAGFVKEVMAGEYKMKALTAFDAATPRAGEEMSAFVYRLKELHVETLQADPVERVRAIRYRLRHVLKTLGANYVAVVADELTSDAALPEKDDDAEAFEDTVLTSIGERLDLVYGSEAKKAAPGSGGVKHKAGAGARTHSTGVFCVNCKSDEHGESACKAPCRNCGKPDHQRKACPSPAVCWTCHSKDHMNGSPECSRIKANW